MRFIRSSPGILERFSRPRGVTDMVQRSFYFHPTGKHLPLGPRIRKRPLGACGSLCADWRTALVCQLLCLLWIAIGGEMPETDRV
jgi:hypothetical protein